MLAERFSVVLSDFHPLVARWFTETLGEPTAAQARGWQAIRAGRHTLIAAPTGSGKTLAAFLTALDGLVDEGVRAPLPDEVRVIYVSPLKALSSDIHKNLAEPRRGIRALAEAAGAVAPKITAAVRTGDTTASERAAMLRTPPHILVTTPESLYLLLTSERSRQMLRTARTVIVDEIHAVIGTRRGAHLALSLERLEALCGAARPGGPGLRRIGLSATQKPVDVVARFLVGSAGGDCAIVDEGHRRAIDLAIEIPRSPLDAVMAHEVWEEYYDRLTELIASHRTTLVFVNTRRLAERVARHLSDRLGEGAVTAHHGSLSKETRFDAEHRLKTGALKALVATASLELGIDIGHVDLVCQVGSPHRIATLLQRVGRSGHTVAGMPKGRLLPVSRDDLLECAALVRSVREGDLDRVVEHDAALDVLAQQIVAEASCREVGEEEMLALVRRAWPYRGLAREDFDAVVRMVSDGFATRRGRRAALVHRDEVHRVLRPRRGSRLLALTSGGAIPEVADYRVVLEPEETLVGTLNEDFAIESMAGDIFQLGNASWRITQVLPGVVRVVDAHGAPPSIPFWFGEAPARSDELSRAVSTLRADVERAVETGDAVAWLESTAGICRGAAKQIASYVASGHASLGVVPTQETLVLERFFDESGGMQLVLHAPFGSRITRAWALALRKRFCRQFNFELQAAATEDALLLSLGPQHSFPLADVFRYLHPSTVRDILVQAFLDAPVFQTRWRWNATISLAVPRNRGGRRVPPQLQRMQADDLMAAVFPDAAACLENIPGDREIPDHPLVGQTVRDCLEEAMDLQGLVAVLERIHRGGLRCIAVDTPEPSAFAHEIINARPYAFLDDAPLEERRTQAVQTRRATEQAGHEIGALDASAIARVRDEARPDPRDADELHDVLLTTGYLPVARAEALALHQAHGFDGREVAAVRSATASAVAGGATGVGSATASAVASGATGVGSAAASAVADRKTGAPPHEGQPVARAEALALHQTHATHTLARAEALALHDGCEGAEVGTTDALALHAGALQAAGRATLARVSPAAAVWVAAERLPELLAVHPGSALEPAITPPPSRTTRAWTREAALVELLRGAVSITGPVTSRALAASLDVTTADTDAALVALESEGVVLRGLFSPGARDLEWCDRRLLARIHRYTLNRLRAEISPVTPADFMRFLFVWQHVAPAARLAGVDGLRAILAQLDGLELPARAWEAHVLPSRLDRYDPAMLDMLCFAGEIGWARLSTGPAQVVGATPVAIFRREHAGAWRALREAAAGDAPLISPDATLVLETLQARGALFSHQLTSCGLADDALRHAIGELVSAGLAASDGFAVLRALIGTAPSPSPGRLRGFTASARHADAAGRWSALHGDAAESARESCVELAAWSLLQRYGVVFRRVAAREAGVVPWRDLARVYRRLEARGEIRGGRFVAGMSGEQFALPDAVERLREVRRSAPDHELVAISGADPLNLTGIITPGDRLRAVAATRIVYRDGVPLLALEGDILRTLYDVDPAIADDAAAVAAGRPVPVSSGYVGRIR